MILSVAMAMQMPSVAAADLRPPPPVMILRRPRSGCDSGTDADAVVVCGDRTSRYRLPLPVERDAAAVTHPTNEAPSALGAITPDGRCGLFAGERRCGKREAARYGYGGGRDPVTVLTRLGRTMIEGDPAP